MSEKRQSRLHLHHYTTALIIFAAVCISAPARSEWVFLLPDLEGDELYLNNKDYVIEKDDFIRMWALNQYKIPKRKKSKQPVASTVQLYEFDCRKRMARFLTVSDFSGPMGTGKRLSYFNYETDPKMPKSEFFHAPPGSMVGTALKVSCAIYATQKK